MATTVKMVVSAGLLTFIFAKVGTRSVGHVLRGAQLPWLAFAVVIAAVAAAVSVVQWQVLLAASGMPRSWRRCLRLDMAGRAFDAALPSAIGGDVVRTVIVAVAPGERVLAARTIVARRITGIPAIVALLAVGVTLSWHHPYAGRILPYALGSIGGGIAGLAVAASPLLGWVATWPGLQRTRISRAVASLLAALHQFRSEGRALVLATLVEFVFWLLVIVNGWAFMRALGMHVPIAYAAVVILTVNVVSMLPISLGGYGLREGTFSLFLAVGGIASSAQGASVGLCITIQTMLMGVVGVPCYLSIGGRRTMIKELADRELATAAA